MMVALLHHLKGSVMRRLSATLLFATLTAGLFASSVNAAEVKAKIDVPKDADVKLDLSKAKIQLTMSVKREPIPFPANFAQMSNDEKRAWYQKFLASDEGKAYSKRMQEAFANRKNYTLKADKDGNVVAKDVAPGNYTLTVQFFKGDNPTRGTDPIADGYTRLSVADQPVDAGKVKINIRRSVNVGDVAPDFDVKTVDGKPLKLSDHRGKYVLVDFWAVWCGPCRGETPNLKATYDAYKSNSRFAMIGLSLDRETKAPIDYAKKNDLGWIQGFLGNWSDDKVTKAYGVRGIPSIWLIGPDGKVVAKGLRGSNIKATVAKYMDKLPD